jgi:hypothetical protein
MKLISTQVINHWFKKILKIKCVSTDEIAYCNIKRRDWGKNYLILNKYLGISKAGEDYKVL